MKRHKLKKKLVKPVLTRFGTFSMTAKSILEHRGALEEFAEMTDHNDEFFLSPEVVSIIASDRFWDDIKLFASAVGEIKKLINFLEQDNVRAVGLLIPMFYRDLIQRAINQKNEFDAAIKQSSADLMRLKHLLAFETKRAAGGDPQAEEEAKKLSSKIKEEEDRMGRLKEKSKFFNCVINKLITRRKRDLSLAHFVCAVRTAGSSCSW
jgi:hypothetical protein